MRYIETHGRRRMNIFSTPASWMTRNQFPAVAAFVALVLTLPSLWVGWQIDDHFHRHVLLGAPHIPALRTMPTNLFALIDGDPERNARLMDVGVLPWWTYEKLRLAFWRPLSALTHWLDYQLWPNSPALMHAQNLLWFAVAIAMAGVLYRRLIGATWVAGLAALLYAIDDAHGLPACWIANRNALIAAAFGLLALLAHDRWRRTGWQPGAVLGPLALLLALLSGESALGAGAYLLAYACFLDPTPPRRCLKALVPYAVVAIGWWLTYHALGYGATGSGPYNDPAQDPLRFAALVLERAPVLLLGQLGFPPAGIDSILSSTARHALWLWALVFLALLSVTLAPLLRRNKLARFFAAGMMLSVLPLCSVFPDDRLLFFVGFGAMGLLALFLGNLRERAPWLPARRSWSAVARTAAVILVVIHVVLAPIFLALHSRTPVIVGAGLLRLADSVPNDPDLAHQQLIIVNTPDAFTGSFLPILRALNNQPLPTHTRFLAPAAQPLELKRLDERTLAIRPALGFLPHPGTPNENAPHPNIDFTYVHQRLDRLSRGDDHPMTLGQQIELTGVTIEITALTNDGRPAEATFRFAVPLEDPSLRWLRCEQGVYVPFTPPAVGDTVHLEQATKWQIE